MMSKYDQEFKEMILSLIASGQTVSQLAKDYQIDKSTINVWRRKAKSPEGLHGKKQLTAEEAEIKLLRKALKEVQLERDIFKKGSEHFLQKRLNKYLFIEEHIRQYSIEKMCQYLSISRNAYYQWKKKGQSISPSAQKTMTLKERIQCIYAGSKQVYGSYRIQKQLAKEAIYVSRSYVGRLMTEMSLRSILKRKFVVTTDSSHSYKVADNHLKRSFTVDELGIRWVSDITYIRVNDSWAYLTTMIDLADRQVVGWSVSEDMTTENTVLKAWIHARNRREIKDDFILHSDRGVQYASNIISSLFLRLPSAKQSMSRKDLRLRGENVVFGYNIFVAESFFKSIKYECLYRFKFENLSQLNNTVNEYIYWYNHKRLHSSLDYLTPKEKEYQIKFNNKVAA
ncbi:IS3 family transposase [Flammeovirga pectinis]|uniref:IS3 family transposase n=1 Tax=Flammeovirga pectinis TaxID=2494373 RepID=A0A3Q9FTF9_9BACT|nr:IS3 family transposase [Flammeovirga pectinis]AZQ65590.1 IS3 family transposase [Flammeovirga pectinis]